MPYIALVNASSYKNFKVEPKDSGYYILLPADRIKTVIEMIYSRL